MTNNKRAESQRHSAAGAWGCRLSHPTDFQNSRKDWCPPISCHSSAGNMGMGTYSVTVIVTVTVTVSVTVTVTVSASVSATLPTCHSHLSLAICHCDR